MILFQIWWLLIYQKQGVVTHVGTNLNSMAKTSQGKFTHCDRWSLTDTLLVFVKAFDFINAKE